MFLLKSCEVCQKQVLPLEWFCCPQLSAVKRSWWYFASENTMLCYSNNTSNKSSSENSFHHCRRIKKAWQHVIPLSLIRWSSPPRFALVLSESKTNTLLLDYSVIVSLMYLQLSKRNAWILHPYLTRSAGMKHSHVDCILCPSLSVDFTQQESLKEQVSLIALF